MTAESFAHTYATTVMSLSPDEARAWIGSWGPTDRAAADSTRREICAADAPVDLNTLAAVRVRKAVAIGGWGTEESPGASDVGAAFRVTAERLSAAIGAGVAVFEQSAHNPQIELAAEFNALLRRSGHRRQHNSPQQARSHRTAGSGRPLYRSESSQYPRRMDEADLRRSARTHISVSRSVSSVWPVPRPSSVPA